MTFLTVAVQLLSLLNSITNRRVKRESYDFMRPFSSNSLVPRPPTLRSAWVCLEWSVTLFSLMPRKSNGRKWAPQGRGLVKQEQPGSTSRPDGSHRPHADNHTCTVGLTPTITPSRGVYRGLVKQEQLGSTSRHHGPHRPHADNHTCTVGLTPTITPSRGVYYGSHADNHPHSETWFKVSHHSMRTPPFTSSA
jgi:hypothetical protein